MNPKLAIALIALSLPLAGCGNKGSLVLPQKPVPVEADLPLAEPPADDAATDDATTDDATAPTPATDAVEPATDADAPLPDPATEEPVPPTPPANDGGNG